MEKLANQLNDSLNLLIENQYSTVCFSDKKIPKKKIQLLFRAARLSPSSSNIQPWSFLLGLKSKLNIKGNVYQHILKSLVPKNQMWAVNAPLLIVSISNNKIDEERLNSFADYDLGQSVISLVLQASEMGLYCHQIGGFNPQYIIEKFKLPSNLTPKSAIAVGYKGDLDTLDEKLYQRELKRISMHENERRKPYSELFYKSDLS